MYIISLYLSLLDMRIFYNWKHKTCHESFSLNRTSPNFTFLQAGGTNIAGPVILSNKDQTIYDRFLAPF